MLSALLLFRDALYGTLVIGVTCGLLGVWVVLRRIVFVGAALAQISSAGIGLAMLLGGLGVGLGLLTDQLALAIVVTLLGAAFFSLGSQRRLILPEATIGVAYAVAGAVGMLLISKAVAGEAHDLFLQGSILGLTRQDVLLQLAVAIPILLVHVVFYKEFLFVSFDPDTARTLGYKVDGWNLLLYLSIGLVIAFAMQSAGVLLVFSFLVLPAVTGLLLARSMAGTFVVAAVSAAAATIIGFVASVPFDLPTGSAVIASSGLLVLSAWAVRRLRGD
ncbi:MAG: ABCMn2+/Zn2+ transporter, inner rane subunit [Gemmatimonadetes bacterium]|nr:ABCMn2+/Zn2+ transporter, inner rane subunit [Gemmatimonadota bacterium]